MDLGDKLSLKKGVAAERQAYKDLVFSTGDGAVTVMAKSDGPASELIADGGVDSEYREAIADAADSEAIDSFDQLDRTVKYIENVDPAKRQRVKALVEKTDGRGIGFIDGASESDLRAMFGQVEANSDLDPDDVARFVRATDGDAAAVVHEVSAGEYSTLLKLSSENHRVTRNVILDGTINGESQFVDDAYWRLFGYYDAIADRTMELLRDRPDERAASSVEIVSWSSNSNLAPVALSILPKLDAESAFDVGKSHIKNDERTLAIAAANALAEVDPDALDSRQREKTVFKLERAQKLQSDKAVVSGHRRRPGELRILRESGLGAFLATVFGLDNSIPTQREWVVRS